MQIKSGLKVFLLLSSLIIGGMAKLSHSVSKFDRPFTQAVKTELPKRVAEISKKLLTDNNELVDTTVLKHYASDTIDISGFYRKGLDGIKQSAMRSAFINIKRKLIGETPGLLVMKPVYRKEIDPKSLKVIYGEPVKHKDTNLYAIPIKAYGKPSSGLSVQ